ncbi:hypothetical protein NHX12_024836 [Muraenolepis orangiensis]|uniref:Sulfotransferase n=1 Tax=Muraenolepis orangiensis TaxID=630683 RepID=A0A9Q0EI87_9TELE|nr:hypothetical protein NHX12_024836 [Muraenolepis orangiensis]
MSEAGSLSYSDSIQEAGGAMSRFPLIPVQGVPLMNHIADNWDSVRAFEPHPSDLLIATYPKAGTTWTQEIVDLLLHQGDPEVCSRGLDLLKVMPPPRVIKTHLPFQLVPEGFWKNKCKVIYVARNAKDNLVSYFHFDRMNQTQPEPGPWDSYIQKFMDGKRYWEEREKNNILYLFYEDMKENPRREVERIMRYLDLSLSDDVIGRIVELTSFKAMKENPMANYTFIPMVVFDQTISPFMRKGEVGDWTNHFTPEQSRLFDEDYGRQMKSSGIPFRANI